MKTKIYQFARNTARSIWRQYRLCRVLSRYRTFFKRNPNAVFLVMTPEHGNLGDHALAYAETTMFAQAGIKYFEITSTEISAMDRAGLLGIMDGHPIIFTGGGNLGTLWHEVEMWIRHTIESNPNSPIVILPNTIFYEDNEWGRKEFEESKRIYGGNDRLYLYARERKSFDIMQEAYQNVRLVPDMVLSMNERRTGNVRKGCLLCLRRDCEKTRSDRQDLLLRSQVKEIFGDDVTDTDTVLNHSVRLRHREEELFAKLDQFSGAELVITDRLHGMIFCAITGTPCIVINSKSPKVRGCYEWIKDLEYIRFADDVCDITAEYAAIPKGEHVYENGHLQHYYDELVDFLKSITA